MKKVGILTFHRAVNYGAVLQTYALCKAIEKTGAEAQVIDYRCDKIENYYYKLFAKNQSVKQLAKKILFNGKQTKRNKEFISFSNNNLPLTKKIYDKHSTNQLNSEFDAVVVGSDQVFNFSCIDGDSTYLLDFELDKGKKFSYAASLGKMNQDEFEAMHFEERLKSFETVSIREESGLETIKNEFKGESRLDIDPTLLLERTDWQALASNDIRLKDFVLVYSVNMPDKVIDEARKLAASKQLPLVIITLENKFKENSGEINLSTGNPGLFLEAFNKASYVVTNSFHGTVFSIINQKSFWTIKNGSAGLDNSRLETLLSRLNITDRFVDRINDYDILINYNNVDESLAELRNDSLNYIRNISS